MLKSELSLKFDNYKKNVMIVRRSDISEFT